MSHRREFGLRNWHWCGLIGLSVALSGCGGSSGKPCGVTGKVKYAGEVVKSGSLRFDPVDKTPGAPGTSLITDGEFKIPKEAGMKAGKFLVSIYATRETGKMFTPPEVLEGQSPGPVKEVVQYIPSKYNTTSTMTVELKPEDNSHDFDLPVVVE